MTSSVEVPLRREIDRLTAHAAELSGLAWLTVSSHGSISHWSRGAGRIYGYSHEEVAGTGVEMLCFPGEESLLCSDLSESRVRVERHRHRDGSEVFVELRVASYDGGRLVCLRDVTGVQRSDMQLKMSREALGNSRGEVKRLAGRLMQGQEAERRRLARDLHDGFQQRLAALGIELAAWSEQSRRHFPDDAEKLAAFAGRVAELGGEIRRVSHELHPAELERLGLIGSLKARAAEIERVYGPEVLVSTRGLDLQLPEMTSLGLYRIAQEALTNAVQHGLAQRIHLTLVRSSPERLTLSILDDGIGFDPQQVTADSLGLLGIRERAELLGGSWRLVSEPGAGTEWEIMVPWPVPDEQSLAPTRSVAGSISTGEALELIGPYRVSRVLGRGSSATVYLAEEPPPLGRKVAIKLYREASESRSLYSFRAESAALARLRHPAVGQIYETRTTEDHRPYLVMEHVAGMPITEYCDRYRLDLDQRIHLMASVCDGAQHVHQKGILHRDLKPDHILVTERDGEPTPKIVDFGIAKGLDHHLAEATVWTSGGAGTPAYVSPEVLAGGEADTRSDVYALGVILYQLLTGVLPAENESALLGQIEGRELPPPGRRLSTLRRDQITAAAAARGIDSTVWARRLSGELGWITGKALAPEPRDRYESAAALAEDLRRHLALEPVSAGPPSLIYRLTKLARRHRVAACALLLAFLALNAGLITSIFQARQAHLQAQAAEKARLDSEQVTEFLEDMLETSDPKLGAGRELSAKDVLDFGAKNLDRLARQPEVQARLQQKIGSAYSALGYHDEAQPLIDASLEGYRRLRLEDQLQYAKSLRAKASHLLDRGLFADALPWIEKALAIQEPRLGKNHLEVAKSLRLLARVLRRQGQRNLAATALKRACRIELAIFLPSDARAVQSLADLGAAYRWLGEVDRAQEHERRAAKLAEAFLGPGHSFTLDLQKRAAIVLAEGEPSLAAEAFERLVPQVSKAYGANHWKTLKSRLRLARLHALDLSDEQAREELQKVVVTIEQEVGPGHWLMVRGWIVLAELAIFRGDYLEADVALERAWGVAGSLDPSRAPERSSILQFKALVALFRGQIELAQEMVSQAGELHAGQRKDERASLELHRLKARISLAAGQLDRAETISRGILSALDESDSPSWISSLHRGIAHLHLGRVLAARGHTEQAQSHWRQSEGILAPMTGIHARVHHSFALLYLERCEEARAQVPQVLQQYRDPELTQLAALLCGI